MDATPAENTETNGSYFLIIRTSTFYGKRKVIMQARPLLMPNAGPAPFTVETHGTKNV